MAEKVNPIPEGFHTVTAQMVISGAAEAIEFYKRAFGAVEVERMIGPDGTSIMHAEIRIGGSPIFLADEFPAMGFRSPASVGARTGSLFLYVKDVDAAYARAVAAGASPAMPVANMFWGDRYGSVIDPFGHSWSIATHREELSQEQIERRAREFYEKTRSC